LYFIFLFKVLVFVMHKINSFYFSGLSRLNSQLDDILTNTKVSTTNTAK